MEYDVRALILQYQGHWKAPLQTDPVCRRSHIGQQLALGLVAADPAGDALDRGAMKVPWISV